MQGSSAFEKEGYRECRTNKGASVSPNPPKMTGNKEACTVLKETASNK